MNPFVAQEVLLVFFFFFLVTVFASVGEAAGPNHPCHIFTLQSHSQMGGCCLETTENLGRNTFCVASEPHLSGRDHKSICFWFLHP